MKRWLLAIALVVTLSPTSLWAASPALLHYQGFLTDMDGQPVDGEWVISFRLYEGEESGLPFFEETRTVYPEKGIFSVVLGAQEDNGLQTEPFQDGEVWMGLEINGIDGPVELEPRQRVVSHPYALFSGHAQLCEQATNALSLGGTAAGSYVTVTQLAELTVTPDELPGLVAEYAVTEEELPALLEALGIGPGGLDAEALQAWLLDNGYLPGPYFSGDYGELLNTPDLSGFCQLPCYGDGDVELYLALAGYEPCVCWDAMATATYLADNGYLPSDQLVTRDGTNSLEGDWDVARNQLLNLVVHNAASETPPEEPVAGQMWFDTTTKLLKFFDGQVWVAIGAGGGVADDLACVECVDSGEVKFKWALSTLPGGPAVSAQDVDCVECIEADEVTLNYAASDSKGGSALMAKDVACLGCIQAEEAGFNWAIAGAPGGIALMAETAVDATMLEGKGADQFETAGAVADHNATVPHLTLEQKEALTGGGETTLHSHPAQPGGSSEAAKVRLQKGDYNLAGNQSVQEYVHVFSSSAPKVYVYLYGKAPTNLLLPNHNHGSHSHDYYWESGNYWCGQHKCHWNTNSVQVGNGNYPLTNIGAGNIPKQVQIWVDGQDVTAAVGNPHALEAPHWDGATSTWGTGGQEWHSNRLDLSNVIPWGVGEHTLELKETGNSGGRLLYYLYIVHPAGESVPLANDTCGTAEALAFDGNVATVSATTEDMLGENKAVDDLAPQGCGGSGGGDVVYSIELAERSIVSAGITAVFEPRLYILDSPCTDQAVLACGTAAAETDELEPGTYYVVVDSDAAEQRGDFILTVTVTTSPLPANDSCDTAELLNPDGSTIQVPGTTKYGVDQYQGTCGGNGGADVVYELEATDLNDDLSVTFNGPFDSRLYLRAQECTNGFQLTCSDSGSLQVQGLTPGIYYLFVDGSGEAEEGAFTLSVTLN